MLAWSAVFPLNSDIQFQRCSKPPMTEFIKGWFTLKHQHTSTTSSPNVPKVNDPEQSVIKMESCQGQSYLIYSKDHAIA